MSYVAVNFYSVVGCVQNDGFPEMRSFVDESNCLTDHRAISDFLFMLFIRRGTSPQMLFFHMSRIFRITCPYRFYSPNLGNDAMSIMLCDVHKPFCCY